MDDNVLLALAPRGFQLRRAQDEPTLTRQLFLSAVLELFSRGMDTDQISIVLNDKEPMVERALHEALTLRKRQKNDGN